MYCIVAILMQWLCTQGPTNPARQWVHPCKCTLIAHEDCLLEWIRASESNPDRSTNNFLKCPQCGSKYELESKDPLALSIMDLGSELLNVLGHGSAIATIGAVVFSFGSGEFMWLFRHLLIWIRMPPRKDYMCYAPATEPTLSRSWLEGKCLTIISQMTLPIGKCRISLIFP